MFTLSDYIILGFVVLTVAVITAFVFLSESNGYIDISKAKKRIILILEAIIIVALVYGCAVYNTHTESGKRHVKSWKSETSGGIDRTVTVYDIEGDMVAQYTGKFDIEESSNSGVVKIKFDSNGKRHIIYAQTGTVLIDEK